MTKEVQNDATVVGLVYMVLRKMIANDVLWTIMTVAVSFFVAHIAYRLDTKMKEVLKT